MYEENQNVNNFGKAFSEMTKEEHFMWCEKKREEAKRYRERKNKDNSGSLRT